MEHIQAQQRRTAAEDFQESLEQLEGILQTEIIEEEITSNLDDSHNHNDSSSENSETIDLEAWEDAVADIEQYLAQKTKKG